MNRWLMTIILCAQLAMAGYAQSLPALFEPIQMEIPAHLTQKPQAVQTQSVIIWWDVLRDAVPNTRFRLNMSKDILFVARIERVERRSATSYSLFGVLENVPDGRVILSIEGDAVAGWIDAAVWNLQYWMGYLRDGAHFIQQIDNSKMPGCNREVSQEELERAGESRAEVLPMEEGTSPESQVNFTDHRPMPEFESDFNMQACTQPMAVFDILILYTTQARDAAGGTNAIRAQAQSAIDVTNQAYIDSSINARVRLAQREAVTYAEDNILGYVGYLNDFTNSSYVQGRRNEFGADVVSAWVSSPADLCGIAHCSPENADNGYNIVMWSCAVGNFSFAHELGHNQGCAHNREDAGLFCNRYSYSYGHRFIGATQGRLRTVMSYASGTFENSTRIGRFSNPNVQFDGRATGIAIGQSNEAHNAQTIINMRRSVEDFRGSRYDVWVDMVGGFVTARGTFNSPYLFLASGVNRVMPASSALQLPILRIKTGTSSQTLTIDKPMEIRACGGLVEIGR